MRILLVEDDAHVAEPLKSGLERHGHDVEHVATGTAALVAAKADLVLLDLGLPDLDGIEVCRNSPASRAAATWPPPDPAAALGHGDPLFWIRDELSAHGQLPPPGIRPEQLAAGSTGSVPAQGGQRDRGQAVDGRLGAQVAGGVEGVQAVGGQLLFRDVAADVA